MIDNRITLANGKSVQLCLNSHCAYCKDTGVGYMCSVCGCIKEANATAEVDIVYEQFLVADRTERLNIRVDIDTFDISETIKTLKRLYRCSQVVLMSLIPDNEEE